jgi:hypothetical protein
LEYARGRGHRGLRRAGHGRRGSLSCSGAPPRQTIHGSSSAIPSWPAFSSTTSRALGTSSHGPPASSSSVSCASSRADTRRPAGHDPACLTVRCQISGAAQIAPTGGVLGRWSSACESATEAAVKSYPIGCDARLRPQESSIQLRRAGGARSPERHANGPLTGSTGQRAVMSSHRSGRTSPHAEHEGA